MKSFMALMAVAVLLVATVSVQNAHAQLELTLGGGMNAPMGEYGDQVNMGYALTAGLGYRVMHMVVLGLETTYNGNKAPDEATASLGPGYDLSTSILQYSALAKVIFPVGNHNVFAKGAVGNYRASAKLSGPLGEASANNTDLGFGLGAGFMLNSASNSAFFADITYNNVSYDGADADTEFFTFTVGAVLRFDLFKDNLHDDVQEDLDKLRD